MRGTLSNSFDTRSSIKTTLLAGRVGNPVAGVPWLPCSLVRPPHGVMDAPRSDPVIKSGYLEKEVRRRSPLHCLWCCEEEAAGAAPEGTSCVLFCLFCFGSACGCRRVVHPQHPAAGHSAAPVSRQWGAPRVGCAAAPPPGRVFGGLSSLSICRSGQLNFTSLLFVGVCRARL